ncbi:unnamed protein product [Paramecium sonneborni]|uniref:Transmembrane protein n=1 Tax=Paramecium sonneborni TaxID=65129 RepID=A0A8S1RMA8_9CILI|nr:unnamed protein product [Paramecium sonneborni]
MQASVWTDIMVLEQKCVYYAINYLKHVRLVLLNVTLVIKQSNLDIQFQFMYLQDRILGQQFSIKRNYLLMIFQECQNFCLTYQGKKDLCTSCDINQNRVDLSAIKKCPCSTGFFQDENGEFLQSFKNNKLITHIQCIFFTSQHRIISFTIICHIMRMMIFNLIVRTSVLDVNFSHNLQQFMKINVILAKSLVLIVQLVEKEDINKNVCYMDILKEDNLYVYFLMQNMFIIFFELFNWKRSRQIIPSCSYPDGFYDDFQNDFCQVCDRLCKTSNIDGCLSYI